MTRLQLKLLLDTVVETRLSLKDRIILQTERWLLLDKPPGLETIVRGGGNTRYCLTSKLRREMGIKEITPIHRLDRDTTGCLLFARQSTAVKPLENLFRAKAVHKEYLGICLGTFNNPRGVIRRKLSQWAGGRRAVRVVKGRGGLAAETEYEVLARVEAQKRGKKNLKLLSSPEFKNGISLVRFLLRTGRTHQVRVHASSLGRPLLGDDQYGDRTANKAAKSAFGLARQALHAWKLAFSDPASGEVIQAEAPLPEDMRAVLDGFFDNLHL